MESHLCKGSEPPADPDPEPNLFQESAVSFIFTEKATAGSLKENSIFNYCR